MVISKDSTYLRVSNNTISNNILKLINKSIELVLNITEN